MRAIVFVLVIAGWGGGAATVHAQNRPNIYGCGIVWGNWLGLTGETAREWDRRSMDKIVEMGGTNCPANFAWIDIEPTQGSYNWDYVDHQVASANARGLEVFAYTGLTPDWALPPEAPPVSGIGYRFPPDEQYIPDFQNFFRTLAARYKGQVKYYEFWNEPNGCSWINDNCSNGHMAHTYVPWLQLWYDAMKEGDPDCVLAVGGLDYNSGVTQGYQYIEDIYANGGGDYFDAVAIHPYGDPLHWQAITDTYQVLVNHGDGHKKLWLNEYGWNTTDENLKASNLTTVLNAFKDPIYHMIFQANYLIITDLPADHDNTHDYGLCSRDRSTLTITPRQSWYAFQALDKTWPEAIAFSADTTLGAAPLSVQFTDESTIVNPTSWLWEFGDGTTSTQQHPAHVYAGEGVYSVSLTVTGSTTSDSLTRTDYIRVGSFPKIAFIGGQMPPTLADSQVIAHLESGGLLVDVYDDERENRPTAAQIAAEHDLVIGSSTLWSVHVEGDFRNEAVPFIFWEPALLFDGREALANGEVASPGHHDLNVLDDAHPLMAGLPAGPVTVTTSDQTFSMATGPFAPGVQILATATGDPNLKTMLVAEPGASLLDGGTAAATRIYLFFYDETWLAANDDGRRLLDNAVVYTLGSVSADFTASANQGTAPLAVSFTDLSTGPVTGWTWDFGDGSPASKLRHPTHEYDTPGNYDVTLTVSGPGGGDMQYRPGYVTVLENQPGDLDGDGDVDQGDYGLMQACLNEPGAGVVPPECEAVDFDQDLDVDGDDVDTFKTCMSGPDQPADPGCAS